MGDNNTFLLGQTGCDPIFYRQVEYYYTNCYDPVFDKQIECITQLADPIFDKQIEYYTMALIQFW